MKIIVLNVINEARLNAEYLTAFIVIVSVEKSRCYFPSYWKCKGNIDVNLDKQFFKKFNNSLTALVIIESSRLNSKANCHNAEGGKCSLNL